MTQEIFDRVVRDGRRRRTRFLGGAAVVVAGLVTAGVVLLPGDTATDRLVAAAGGPPTSSPTDCPATAEVAPSDSPDPAAVPQLPRGFDGRERLLPDEVPSSVVVCRYDGVLFGSGGEPLTPAQLLAGRVVEGNLDGFADALELPLPGSFETCRFVGPVGAEPVRVRISYPSGAWAWLSTQTDVNGCASIGNGLAVSQNYVAPALLEAWEVRRWGPTPSPTPAETVTPVSEADCPTEAAPLSRGRGDEAGFPVPAPPEGFDASARLVPDETPAAVLICRYEIPSESNAIGALIGGKPIIGDLVDLARVLDVPLEGDFGVCTEADKLPEPLRVLLRYRSGARVWLTTETDLNSCTGIGNGAVSNDSTYLAQELLDAWHQGRWEPSQPSFPCDVPDAGRPGQMDVLVPDGFDAVSLCRGGTFEPVGDEAAIVGLLNAASTVAPPGFYLADGQTGRYTGAGCDGDGTSDPVRREVLRVGYPTGRSVAVSVTVRCTPSWQNGTLGAQPTSEQQAQLLDLLDR